MSTKNTLLRLPSHIENILTERYYLKAETSWETMAWRLCETIDPAMFELIKNRSFIPSTPTLMNLNTRGERKGTLSSCFILDIEDSMDEIMDAMKEAAFVTKAAGGVGYNFSKLRGASENVKSISANSGGVMAFIGIFDAVLDGVRQGGRRRGAGMSMLSIYHPDILRFIDAKAGDTKKYTRSNFSVAPDDEFYTVLEDDPNRIFQTRNVVGGAQNDLKDEAGRTYTYQMLWDKIIHNAWLSAEPGIFNSSISADRCTCKHITRNVFCNPCLTGDILIQISIKGDGSDQTQMRLDEFCHFYNLGIWKQVYVRTADEKDNSSWQLVSQAIKTKDVIELIEIAGSNGKTIQCTPEHKILTKNRGWVEAQNLIETDELVEE